MPEPQDALPGSRLALVQRLHATARLGRARRDVHAELADAEEGLHAENVPSVIKAAICPLGGSTSKCVASSRWVRSLGHQPVPAADSRLKSALERASGVRRYLDLICIDQPHLLNLL